MVRPEYLRAALFPGCDGASPVPGASRSHEGSSSLSEDYKIEALKTGNLFLDTLPAASAKRVVPYLERIEAGVGAKVASSGLPLEHVVFPIAGVVSAVTRMRDGSDVEIVVVGREGFYGMQVVLGSYVSANEAMVQIPNSMYFMRATDFRKCLDDDDALRKRALFYVQATIDAMGQFSGCNRLHPINERCARWLLMAHDRIPTDELFLTHEFLATMLGVRRPGVSVAAAALESAGLIEYRRGRIVIRNRRGLEAASCECYGVANDAIVRVLGYDIRKAIN
jgi:CRP-like cAMP-binding protein